jgi:hypothetical protein
MSTCSVFLCSIEKHTDAPQECVAAMMADQAIIIQTNYAVSWGNKTLNNCIMCEGICLQSEPCA